MKIAAIPENEQQRLEALRSYHILDSEVEEGFESLTQLAAMLCGTPIAVISLVDQYRQWFKSAHGLPGVPETSRDVAFCAHAILQTDLMEVDDARADERFHDNPLVIGAPNIRFYAGTPLIDSQGFALGTLCVIDTQAKLLTAEQKQELTRLARAAMSLIQARVGNHRFRNIAEHAPYGIAVVDEAGKIRQPNSSWLRLLGFSKDELVGQPLSSVLMLDLADAQLLRESSPSIAALANALTSTHPSGENSTRVRDRYGQFLAVEVGFSVLGDGLTAVMLIDVSVRDAVAREAERSKNELQRIIDHMPFLVGYWGRDMINRFGNQAYKDWFGSNPDELRGRHAREVLGETVYLANIGYMEAALRGEAQVFERSIVTPGGETRQAIATYIPDLGDDGVEGFYAFVHDISPLKAAEAARATAEAQLQGVIDAANEFSIITTDLAGIITLFSRGAERMLGYAAADIIGKHTLLLLHLDEEIAARGREIREETELVVNGFEVLVHHARNGASESREWTYRRADVSTLTVNLVISGIRDQRGELIGFLGVAHDVGAAKQYQQSLASAKEAAEAASRAKSNFVANMSHEIRTPMNAVLGMTHLLDNTALNSEQREYTEMIRTAGQSLLSILNDILDFSKIEAGKMDLDPREFLLDDLLKALGTMMAVNVGTKDVEMTIAVEPRVPRQLIGDSLRVQQTVTNLVANALKFTERGEIAVSIHLLELRAKSVLLRFDIKDTGIGISSEHQSKLFTAFSQADASTTRRFGGTGLGLTISKRMVELMGGEIGIHSQPGFGSCFWFTVPFGMTSRSTQPLPTPDMNGLRVLLADDNTNSLAALHDLVCGWNWQAHCAPSGEMAVQQYLQQAKKGTPYQLAIIDWQMPGMDGLQALAEMKADPAQRPMIIMTNARDRKALEDSELRSCADAVIIKPVTAGNLFDAVRDAFAHVRSPERSGISSSAKPAPGDRLDHVRVLLVEDNEFNQIVARGILESIGASVEIAENGLQAVNTLRERHADFDIVLMDAQMPVMDGFEATRVIRQSLHLSLPVLAMTAGVLPSEREQCIQMGMNDFIAKPIQIEQMLTVMRKNLRQAADTAVAALTVAPPPDNKEILNIEALLAACQHNPDFISAINGLLQRLCDTGPASVAEIHAAWQTGDIKQAMALLHKIRGSLGSLGAKQLAAISLELEHALGEGRSADAERGMPQLEREMDLLVAAARLHLQPAAAPAETPPPTPVLDRDKFTRFRRALVDHNMAAVDLYPDLRPFLASRMPEGQIDTLDQTMRGLSFDDALRIVVRVNTH